MSVKQNRNYILTIDGPAFKTPLQIALPFTIEFDISRDTYAGSNYAEIRLYNLSLAHRTLLLHDQFNYNTNADDPHILNITLQAGYGPGPQWPVVFSGNVTRAYSVRQGVDFITTMQAFDGGRAYNNATSNHPFSNGQSMQVVYQTLINDLIPYGVNPGVLSAIITKGNLSKGQAYSGNTIDLLRELSHANFYIDNLKANVVSPTEAIQGNNVTIDASSGLLGTPYKEQQVLYFDILFEPRLVIGSIVNVQSSTTIQSYNGPHKVVSVHHRGMISPTVCGDAITKLGCQAGVFAELAAKGGF